MPGFFTVMTFFFMVHSSCSIPFPTFVFSPFLKKYTLFVSHSFISNNESFPEGDIHSRMQAPYSLIA